MIEVGQIMTGPLFNEPMTRRPIAVDLFSGAGGMSLGFEQAGFDILLAVDRDGYHVAAHKRNFPYGVGLCCSVNELGGDSLRNLVSTDHELDLVFGGPPCQGFSHMGLRDPGDLRNTLVDEFARLVGELRPKAFVMENVVGMQSGKTREVFDRLVNAMAHHGYVITWPVRTLNAMDFGVPQNRARLFVLGLRGDIRGKLVYPETSCIGQPPRPTILQAIADLPDVERFDHLYTEDEVTYDKEPSPTNHYARVARGLERDPSDLSRPREWHTEVCTGCVRVRHADSVRSLYAATPPGAMVPGHKLPRLDPNGIAPTLRAGSESERGSHTAPRPVHPLSPRCITVREAARLHGFPDWFRFYPAKWHAYRQIGNAVCPPVARAVGYSVIAALGLDDLVWQADPVHLGGEFVLPENRARYEGRLPQMEEFPKVIDFLFREAYDKRRNFLVKDVITTEDIKRAYLETGAQVPRIRPERFLSEIAHSRNVEKILGLPLECGYSILSESDGEIVGRFVPAWMAGTISDKDYIEVRSKELVSAPKLDAPAGTTLESREHLVRILQDPKVLKALTGSRNPRLGLERDLFGLVHGSIVPFVLFRGRSRKHRGCLVLAPGGRIPSRSKLTKVGDNGRAAIIIVVSPLTLQHVFLALLERGERGFMERRRLTYRVVAEPPPAVSRRQRTTQGKKAQK